MTNKLKLLNGNILKIIAAVAMLVDHIGSYLLPEITALRIIGRLAFPLFAFMIAEGARYTKNRVRYISLICGCGLALQAVLYALTHTMRFNIMITFTLSLLVIFALDFFKASLFNKASPLLSRCIYFLVLLATSAAVLFMSRGFAGVRFEYGVLGCMFPVFASVPSLNRTSAPSALKKLDNLYVRIACMCIPMLYHCYASKGIQWFALIALIPLLLYSEKRGTYNLKYFFYIFYPAHLIIIIILNQLIY